MLARHANRGPEPWAPNPGALRHDEVPAVNVNYQTIGYLERGEYNPSLELALRVAEYFGLPVEVIFSRSPFIPMSDQLYAGGARSGDVS